MESLLDNGRSKILKVQCFYASFLEKPTEDTFFSYFLTNWLCWMIRG